MADDDAGAPGGSGEAGLYPLFRLGVAQAYVRAQIVRAEAIFARLKEDWVDEWDDPAEFKAVEVDKLLTIESEDDGGLTLLIEEIGGDYALITLSADQVAALRQWLTP